MAPVTSEGYAEVVEGGLEVAVFVDAVSHVYNFTIERIAEVQQPVINPTPEEIARYAIEAVVRLMNLKDIV